MNAFSDITTEMCMISSCRVSSEEPHHEDLITEYSAFSALFLHCIKAHSRNKNTLKFTDDCYSSGIRNTASKQKTGIRLKYHLCCAPVGPLCDTDMGYTEQL